MISNRRYKQDTHWSEVSRENTENDKVNLTLNTLSGATKAPIEFSRFVGKESFLSLDSEIVEFRMEKESFIENLKSFQDEIMAKERGLEIESNQMNSSWCCLGDEEKEIKEICGIF
jgi:hypothetical protein